MPGAVRNDPKRHGSGQTERDRCERDRCRAGGGTPRSGSVLSWSCHSCEGEVHLSHDSLPAAGGATAVGAGQAGGAGCGGRALADRPDSATYANVSPRRVKALSGGFRIVWSHPVRIVGEDRSAYGVVGRSHWGTDLKQ